MGYERWTRQEREVLRQLGGERSARDDRREADVRVGGWAVLLRERATAPAWVWKVLDRARRAAGPGERAAVVLTEVSQGRKARRLVLLDFDQWRALVGGEGAARSADEALSGAETGAKSAENAAKQA